MNSNRMKNSQTKPVKFEFNYQPVSIFTKQIQLQERAGILKRPFLVIVFCYHN